MSATSLLREDHKQIRRFEKVVIQCYKKLYSGIDIPLPDIERIVIIMKEFLDSIHYTREEDAYFPCVLSYGSLKDEIRAFMIEHEFSRRIANSVQRHLQGWIEGKDEREAVARFLKAYAVYLDDHMTKEEKFFDKTEAKILSKEEEMMIFEEFRAVTAVTTKLDELLSLIDYLEQRDWMID